MSAQSKYYNTGGGELYFSKLVNGVLETEVAFGQTENITFSSEIETLKHDNTEGAVTVEDLSILKKVTGKLAIDTVEVSPDMLVRAFLGSNNSSAVGANVIAVDATLGYVTATLLDTAYPIGVKYLDEATIVVKDATDITTYVLNTDYSLSTTNGVTSITALTGGAITALAVIHVTGNNSAYSDILIEAFIDTKLEGQVRFVSKPANGVAYTYTFHKVSLLASGDFALKSAEEFATISFEGDMLASELVVGAGQSKLFKIEGSELTA